LAVKHNWLLPSRCAAAILFCIACCISDVRRFAAAALGVLVQGLWFDS
jgi:hypothetical protein